MSFIPSRIVEIRKNFRAKIFFRNVLKTGSLLVLVYGQSHYLTKATSSNNIMDFKILKTFKVSSHPPKATRTIEVIWQPPIYSWVKYNTDGGSLSVPDRAACGDIFRDHYANLLGCFAENLGQNFALNAEFIRVMRAIELAADKN